MRLPKKSTSFGVGKEIGGAIYIHKSSEGHFGSELEAAKRFLPQDFEYEIVKKNLKTAEFSFIQSTDFDSDDEPSVGDSILVKADGSIKPRKQPMDPEIYHHKWLFVDDEYRGFDIESSRQRSIAWMALSDIDKRRIGKKSYWEQNVLPRLEASTEDSTSDNHETESVSEISEQTIDRHKTAIKRASYSKPLKCLLRDGLLREGKDYFDYGCGHGRDLNLLSNLGYKCSGWDPAFRPEAERQKAAIVNIGYVINVVEDPKERKAALHSAWKLANEVLCVAAQIEFAAPDKELPTYGDGCLTSRGTFQKYYNQHELREYLQSVLETDAISAAPGIFYLFKSEEIKQQFFADRYQRRYTVPRRKISEVLFEENKELLEPFMERLTELGRIPLPEEYPQSEKLIEKFGSVKRAFKLIQKVTDESPWEDIAQKRGEDLLVYLALSRFGKRPPSSRLPKGVQRDLKEFLGGYKIACARADTLLFRVGDSEAIDEACQRADLGQLVDNALIIHRSCLEQLEPLLRIYEGCARALVGDLEDANVIKLHRFSGKVSYITYEDFEKKPHPPLKERMKISLRSLNIDWFDYADWGDPYLLMTKAKLLPKQHPKYQLFARLCQKQQDIGLLDDQLRESELRAIFHRNALTMRGHQITLTAKIQNY